MAADAAQDGDSGHAEGGRGCGNPSTSCNRKDKQGVADLMSW